MMFNLFGCSKTNSIKSEKNEMKEVAKKIVSYIETHDSDSLEKLFSNNVKYNMDFDSGRDYTFNLYKGSCEDIVDSGTHIQDYFDKGTQTKTALSYFDIKTNENTYVLYFEYIMKSNDDNNIGIKRIKLSDYNTAISLSSFNYGNEYECLGIYNPDWDNAQ